MTLELPLPVGDVDDEGPALSLHLNGIELNRSASGQWAARPAPADPEGLRWGGTVQPLRRRP